MRRIVILGGLAALAMVALRSWMPQYDHLFRQGLPSMSQQEAHAGALALLQHYGLPTDGWRFGYVAASSRRIAVVRAKLNSPVAAQFSPLSLEVHGYRNRGAETVSITFTQDGRPLTLRFRNQQRPGREDLDDPALASQVLAEFAGSNASQYVKTVEGSRTQSGLRTVWDWPDPGQPGLLARFEVLIRGGRVVSAQHSLQVSETLLDSLDGSARRWRGVVATVSGVAFWCVAGLILYGFFSAFTRHALHLRIALASVWTGAFFLLLRILTGRFQEQVASNLGREAGSFLGAYTSVVISECLPILLGGLVLAAGYAVMPAAHGRAWIGVRLLARGRLLARPVGRDFAAGMVAGPILIALLYLPAALGMVTEAADLNLAERLLNRAPPATLFDPASYWVWLLPAGFLYPWAAGRKTLRWLSLVVAAILGAILWMLFALVYREALHISFLLACTALLGTAVLYRVWGLLAAWVAPVSGVALYIALALNSCPDETLRDTGWQTFLIWLGAAAVCLLLGWKGEEVDESALQAAITQEQQWSARSEGDRLRADFDVARQAQQNMLPAAAPAIPGYSLAAHCHPALEVGGDLYDFLSFPTGETGLCVADVSGKGVSAALYMTMTKGMLAAAQEEPASLPTILTRLNRHWRAWSRRRSFVTISLALLEPASGRLLHARAGHNPPLLCRDGAAMFLQPSGLGLGLAPDALFQSVLQVDEQRLNPGDIFVSYSDGLTECMNVQDEQYGEERLKSVLLAHCQRTAAGIAESILADVRAFQGAARPHDDLTLLVLKREPATGAVA